MRLEDRRLALSLDDPAFGSQGDASIESRRVGENDKKTVRIATIHTTDLPAVQSPAFQTA